MLVHDPPHEVSPRFTRHVDVADDQVERLRVRARLALNRRCRPRCSRVRRGSTRARLSGAASARRRRSGSGTCEKLGASLRWTSLSHPVAPHRFPTSRDEPERSRSVFQRRWDCGTPRTSARLSRPGRSGFPMHKRLGLTGYFSVISLIGIVSVMIGLGSYYEPPRHRRAGRPTDTRQQRADNGLCQHGVASVRRFRGLGRPVRY